tara:strand:+ start:21 stop:449 length:429 start_codon:yes stop_codon:yes gene_type:complete
MIKYKLICSNCDLRFDSWFSSSIEYEKLKKKNFINCHKCGSQKVEKTLMSPQLINNNKKLNDDLDQAKHKNIKKTLKNYQKFIKDNFKYVGENFAYEARSIHYDQKKKKKRIYGHATKKDLQELKEEGIKTEMVPWIDDKEN